MLTIPLINEPSTSCPVKREIKSMGIVGRCERETKLLGIPLSLELTKGDKALGRGQWKRSFHLTNPISGFKIVLLNLPGRRLS